MEKESVSPAPERWLPVVGYEGYYEVSSHGRVRSLDRTARVCGGGVRKVKGRLLPTFSYSYMPYVRVNLWKGGVGGSATVHRLVLEAFVGPCPPGMECRHYPDQNPANNRLDNISWATPKVNALDRIENGTSRQGEKSHLCRITKRSVLTIRRRYASGKYSQSRLAEMYGLTQSYISQLVLRKRWKHI